jgi:hypothetical protein
MIVCACAAWLLAACAAAVEGPDGEELTIEIVTLACASECADIQAIAHGGRPPYAFQWADGSTDPVRQFCRSADAQLLVTAVDTPDPDAELPYAGQIASASAAGDTIDCSAAGAPPPDGAAL